MATQKQIEANRQNAQKSTGPKTAEGKAAVSQNALRHGLCAAGAVITGENPADYLAYHDQMLAELAPVGEVETMLAERVVGLSWRLKRAERMHTETIDVMLARTETNYWEKNMREDAEKAQDPRAAGLELMLGWASYSDFSKSKVLDRLMLYERRIENSLYKTLNRLKQYQVIRRIELDETRKHQPAQAIPIPMHDNRDEAATRPAYNLSDLKKQSQFAPVRAGARSLIKEDYGNKSAGRDQENNTGQSQIHNLIPPKSAENGKNSFISVNLSGK